MNNSVSVEKSKKFINNCYRIPCVLLKCLKYTCSPWLSNRLMLFCKSGSICLYTRTVGVLLRLLADWLRGMERRGEIKHYTCAVNLKLTWRRMGLRKVRMLDSDKLLRNVWSLGLLNKHVFSLKYFKIIRRDNFYLMGSIWTARSSAEGRGSFSRLAATSLFHLLRGTSRLLSWLPWSLWCKK